MTASLQSYLVSSSESLGKVEGEVVLVEPNGDKHSVQCASFPDGHLEVCGDGEMMDYLNERYTPQGVSSAVRKSLNSQV